MGGNRAGTSCGLELIRDSFSRASVTLGLTTRPAAVPVATGVGACRGAGASRPADGSWELVEPAWKVCTLLRLFTRRSGLRSPPANALRIGAEHGYLACVNWHEIIEERSFEMDQVVSDVLRRDPAKLDRVVDWIERRLVDPDYSVHSKDALAEWLDLIMARGLDGVLEKLADRSEDAFRMRHSSPFAVVMPQEERRRILRRYEALRPRTHPASV